MPRPLTRYPDVLAYRAVDGVALGVDGIAGNIAEFVAGLAHDLLQRFAQWPGRYDCLLYTSPSSRDRTRSRMPSSA